MAGNFSDQRGLFGSMVRPELNHLAEGLHLAAILAAVVTLLRLLSIVIDLRISG
ncbi:hypothetical protein [Paraburkholderia sp. 40]|uniref:hypothetical protein n=1 Tax=unclassified Paraburkholderia TaxID=2615204 RepID=UPI003D24468B